MPRAGFWAIGGYKISFRSDGRWYADEEVIANYLKGVEKHYDVVTRYSFLYLPGEF